MTIPASELIAMREAVEAILPDTCTIKRCSRTADGAGGFTEAWSDVATVKGRLAPAGARPDERAVADRLGVLVEWALTLPALTDVGPGDRVSIGGRTLEVVWVFTRSTEVARRVLCREVA